MNKKIFPNIELPIVDQTSLPPEILALHTEALFGKLVKQINLRLTGGTDYEQVLDYIFESMGLLIPFDRIGIALIDDKEESLCLSWIRSKGPIVHLQKNYSAPIKNSSLMQIINSDQPRVINNLPEHASLHPDSASTLLALNDGIKSSLTCPLRSRNKSIGVVFFSSFSLNSYNHNHIEVFRDVANELSVVVEQGRLQNFFIENQPMVKSFRNVVHDMRAPLSIVKSYLDLAMNENWFKDLEPEAKIIFSTLSRNTDYMFQLISDLSELNQKENEFRQQNTQSFCLEMAKRGEILAKSKEINFEYTFENLPTSIELDYEKICRVIDNLFTNAVKFSHRKSFIKFQVNSKDNKIYFNVIDSGQGIPENEHHKLFNEFGKTSTRPTEGEGSTGLGLILARKFVIQHRGQISFVSQHGKGSTFTFWIPLTQ